MEKTKIDCIKAAITQLYYRDGEVRASALVEAARPQQSPIHNAFEWNNRKAGHEYRLIQARQWIRNVTIIIDDRTPERLVHVPVFDSLDTSEGYYRPISVVVQSHDEYAAALKSTLATLTAARAAYVQLKKAAVHHKQSRISFRRADRAFELIEKTLAEA